MNGWLTLRSLRPTDRKPTSLKVDNIGFYATEIRCKFYLAWGKQHITYRYNEEYLFVDIILADLNDSQADKNTAEKVDQEVLTPAFVMASELMSVAVNSNPPRRRKTDGDIVPKIEFEVEAFELSYEGKVHTYSLERIMLKPIPAMTYR